MKKTQKKCLGFVGLSAVVAMTSVALVLPGPNASTISTITDTINVRVVGETPNVDITGIASGSTFVLPEKNVKVTYEHVNTMKVTLQYTVLGGGAGSTYTLVDEAVSDDPGEYNFAFDFNNPGYGYGSYVLTAEGVGEDGAKDTDIIEFTYLPFIATLDEVDEKTYVDLEYDNETGDSEIDKFVIEVLDKNGNLVTPLSPIEAFPPETRVNIPFEKYDLEPGKYTVRVIAKNVSGEDLFVRDLEKDIPEIPVPGTDTPDTGSFFRGVGVSQSDFLISGLVVFFILGISGVAIILRKNKKA
ncbi:fibronectin type III domain-containing protein [Candidatus Saccharibacteria bacterium]|nr:fibronectin type III domain-containing protein [Candidatus Saccharibacteria bacterium]